MGSIIGRMAAPGSERATHRLLGQRSALGELLDVDYEAMSLMQLYRASDALMAHRDAIERHVFQHVSELFSLNTTITLYDLTNTYFEGEARHQHNAQRGCSREKRNDRPLLTLLQMLAGLDAPAGALIVMERGVATEANLQWLREAGYRYLVVSRERTRRFDPDLLGAFAEFEAISQGTRAKEYLYSLSINPPKPITREQYQEAIQEIEHGLGLNGQPRAVVFHVKDGREHCHVVWSRINVEQMKAVQMSFDHSKLMDLGCKLAKKAGVVYRYSVAAEGAFAEGHYRGWPGSAPVLLFRGAGRERARHGPPRRTRSTRHLRHTGN